MANPGAMGGDLGVDLWAVHPIECKVLEAFAPSKEASK